MRYTWERRSIDSAESANTFIRMILGMRPRAMGFDTETTGLHIIKSRMFLFQTGFTNEATMRGYVATIETHLPFADQFIKDVLKCAEAAEYFLAQNTKYDLHMLKNSGYSYTASNLTDLMFYIRWGHDNVQIKKGGPPLGLKDYCARYVDTNAKNSEQEIKALRKQFKKTNGRDAGYHEIDRSTVTRYAADDIILMLEAFWPLQEVVALRGNEYAIKVENDVLLPLFEMERVGFKADKAYLLKSEQRVREYIKESYQLLYNMTGVQFTVGQHQVIKEIINTVYNTPCSTTNAEALNLMMDKLDPADPVIEFIKLVQELRTLDKWYATYITRFINELEDTDTLYTTINQVGTVSGRVTSDFQQFPKEGIVSRTGETLYTPRKMVITRGGNYDKLVYLDYSQIELRVQALYTILLDHPDTNLCRAYMPYKCIDSTGKTYSYFEDKTKVKEVWYYEEDPTQIWEPTDLHAATAVLAFNVSKDDPKFKKYRSLAKRINFAKNYGAQLGRISAMFPNASEEEVRRINDSYYKAFPGIKHYHSYCYAIANAKPYVGNLFGVRYYNVSGHNLINMLIQGSSATLLKIKIRELYDYTKAHHIKSRFQMNIHDELSWEKHKDESMEVFDTFKKIMESWSDSAVPIVAEMEVSDTCWAEKHEVHDGE